MNLWAGNVYIFFIVIVERSIFYHFEFKKRKKKEEKGNSHLTVGIAPVVPSTWNDDVVHVCVCKHYPREGAPCPTQIERTRPGNFAIYKREACVFQQTHPVLCCQGSIVSCYCMNMASLYYTINNLSLFLFWQLYR
jgi:hypothetical protein